MKRVLLIEDLPQVAEHLKGLLAREEGVEVGAVQGQADAAIAWVKAEQPEIVLVDALLQGKMDGFEVARRVRAASPATRIVMVTVPQKPVTAKPGEGIDAVLVLPGGANELRQAMGTGEKGGRGRSVAVYSPKGGSGRTTLAVNLAVALRRLGHSVALVDGVMQFGSIRHQFEVPQETRSVVDLPAAGAMKQELPNALWAAPGGLDVLLAPARPEQAELVGAAELAGAIGELAGGHDFVVVDTPNRLSEDTLAMLDAAEAIVLVVTYDPTAVAHARAALETFDALGYRKQKPFLLVVNRADETTGLSRAAVEQALGLSVAAQIPTDRKVVNEAQGKGQPFVLTSPNAPISKAVAELATALAQSRK